MPDDEAHGADPAPRPNQHAPEAPAAAEGPVVEEPAVVVDRDAAPQPEAASVTPGGYSYEVVDDEARARDAHPGTARGGGAPWWLLILAAIVPAVIAAGAVWLVFGRDDGGGSGSTSTAGSLLNAFTSGSEDVETRRFEGEVPPGYPETLPEYEDAPVVASVLQIQGDGLGYIVVQSADRSRDDVAAEMREAYDADPWQIDGGQDSRDATLFQFTKIDDPDITGLVLLTQSKNGDDTTIITSVQIASGADDLEEVPFEAVAGRPAPDGLPSEIPVFEGSIITDTAFQNSPDGDNYALTYIAKGEIGDVIDFYRSGLEDAGLTVEDGDASTSALEDAQSLTFNDEELELQGDVTVGVFPLDEGYVQIDVQVGDQRDPE